MQHSAARQRTWPLMVALALCIVAVIALLLPAAVSARSSSSLFDRRSAAAGVSTPSRSRLFSSRSLGMPSMCPATLSLPDPSAPEAPEGYTFLRAPVVRPSYANASWYMVDVLHSNSATWLPGHIVCKYAACANYGCPTVALLSNATYTNPAKPDGASWGNYRSINDTLICAPADHQVSKCLFS